MFRFAYKWLPRPARRGIEKVRFFVWILDPSSKVIKPNRAIPYRQAILDPLPPMKERFKAKDETLKIEVKRSRLSPEVKKKRNDWR